MTNVTIAQVINSAKLAKINLSDDEVVRFQSELEKILSYIALINECDLSTVEDKHNLENFSGEILSEDEIDEKLADPKKILSKVTENRLSPEGYIITSKIV